jgi:N-acetylglucosamine kinase-like BadF-type ATPase
MKLFLGVDGGQSSTVALIADETGRVLGAGNGGPCNHVAADEGRTKFARALQECLSEASAQAGLDASTITFEAACLGFSGGIADKDAYSREFIRSQAFSISNDAEIALTGATGGDPGIIVIAGTGSIAFGRNAEGRTARAGGWGYLFGDEGGAFDLARQALRAALAMEEGWGPATLLREHLLQRTGMLDANGLMHDWYNNFDRTKLAQFAPLLDGAAKDGDAVATEILRRAGRQLAALVTHIHGMLFARGHAVRVAHIGGVFASATLTEALRSGVRALVQCDVTAPLYPPAVGALLTALKMAGLRVALSAIPAVKQ